MADRLDSGSGVESKVRVVILESWMGLPKMRNSVFVGLRESRLADIQPEIWEIDDWRSWIDEGKLDGVNEINN